MTYNVIVAPKARRQIDAYDDWWRANRPAAPDLLRTEYERVLERLATFPNSGHTYAARSGPARYLLMPRSRYHVFYRIDGAKGVVRVLTVWSAVRGTQPSF